MNRKELDEYKSDVIEIGYDLILGITTDYKVSNIGLQTQLDLLYDLLSVAYTKTYNKNKLK